MNHPYSGAASYIYANEYQISTDDANSRLPYTNMKSFVPIASSDSLVPPYRANINYHHHARDRWWWQEPPSILPTYTKRDKEWRRSRNDLHVGWVPYEVRSFERTLGWRRKLQRRIRRTMQKLRRLWEQVQQQL